MNFTRKITLLLLAALMLVPFAQAKDVDGITISGQIKLQGKNSPVDFANVVLEPTKDYAITDKDGNFSIRNIQPGQIKLTVSFYGLESKDTTLTVGNKDIYLKMYLQETSFSLDKVTVVATQSKAGSSTSSKISRQAMDHMQTSSVYDVLALLPGGVVTNPNLNSAQSITLRTAGGTGSSVNMNSLGTAIMVDGAPMSNNANMQVLSPTISGQNTYMNGAESVTAGIDARTLSTDNIESIEVIRGVASAQYGDLTSGAVLVTSKAGKSPFVVRFKTNPNIYQGSISKGFGLGGKAGDLNISGDYAYSTPYLTKSYQNYQRVNAKALWSVLIGDNTTENTALTLLYHRDSKNPNPDEVGSKAFAYANSLGVQFNTNGHSYLNKGWLKSINWLASFSYTDKTSHEEDMASNATSLYSTAMQDGLIYTDTRGENVYDMDGNRITNVDSDSQVCGRVLPYSYLYAYDIYGKELNGFAKLNTELGKTWDNISERILVGVDYKTDGNLGQGAVYQDETPPFRNVSNSASGYRRRPYYDIPFVNQIGAYLENTFSLRFAEQQEFILATGLRYDWVNGKMLLQPRVNASVDPVKWMTVRAAWGLSGKAPTSIYLYPNYAYHDAILYNNLGIGLPQEQELLIAKTSVYDCSNPDLEIVKNYKTELGLDFKFAKHYRISLTAYREHTPNGYTFGQDASCFRWEQYTPYVSAGSREGTYPLLTQGTTYNAFFETYKPLNKSDAHNYGLEYEIDLGRFDAINTSLYINGAWMNSRATSNSETYSNRANGGNIERHIGVYAPGVSTSCDEMVNTAIRATTNIPKIGFVITLSLQCQWMEKYWTEYQNDDMFVKYISYKDGQVHDFDPAMKTDPEFAYMFPSLSDSRFIVEQHQPYVYVNFNLSKEIGKWLTASFYVNNLFNTRPLYRSNVSGAQTELSIPIYFGFEFKVTI